VTARTWFLLTVLVLAGVLVWSAFALPDRVPVHFGLTGEADRFVSRTRALVELGLLGAGLVLVFLATEALARRGPLSLVNVPHKAHWTTPEREPELRSRLSTDVWVFGTMTVGLVAAVAVVIVLVADQPDPTLGGRGWVLIGVYLAVVTTYSTFVITRRYRPEGT